MFRGAFGGPVRSFLGGGLVSVGEGWGWLVLARLRVVFGADVGPGRDALGGLGLGFLAVWFTFVGVLRGGGLGLLRLGVGDFVAVVGLMGGVGGRWGCVGLGGGVGWSLRCGGWGVCGVGVFCGWS